MTATDQTAAGGRVMSPADGTAGERAHSTREAVPAPAPAGPPAAAGVSPITDAVLAVVGAAPHGITATSVWCKTRPSTAYRDIVAVLTVLTDLGQLRWCDGFWFPTPDGAAATSPAAAPPTPARAAATNTDSGCPGGHHNLPGATT